MTAQVPTPDPPGATDPALSATLVRGRNPRERIKESLWQYVGQPLFRFTFHNWYAPRRALLRLFGADIHPTARVRPSVRISHPWNLTVGAHTAVGDQAILFCLGPINIGARCTISQYAHLCAAGHDYKKRDMPLIKEPIHIEDDVWLAADVFVGPGVTIGADTVVGARSTVFHSLPPKSICAGDNARRLGQRTVRFPPPPATLPT
jgi:putative colanic acid biosynthesis acetyltransferase WcaF